MQTIYIDISRSGVMSPIQMKQGDVGRKFEAVITDGGVAYNIPSNVSFSVWYSGASGEGNYTAIGEESAFTIDGNTVTVELITQMATNSGLGAMCLIMNSAGGSQLGVWNIPYMVEKIPGAGSEAAQQYYTAFSEAVANLSASVLPSEEKSLILNLFRKAAFVEDVSETIAALESAWGMGAPAKDVSWDDGDGIYLPADCFHIGEFGNAESPYYGSRSDRMNYREWDIPVEYGYTYKFSIDTDYPNVQIGIICFSEATLQLVSENESISDMCYDSGWKENGVEFAVPQYVGEKPTCGVRMVFRVDTDNSDIPDGMIKSVTITRRAV